MRHYYFTVTAFLVAAIPLFSQRAPKYNVHDLGLLKDGAVTGINIHGQVIGYETLTDGRVHSFRTAPNAAINWATDDLGTLGGTVARASGINASGQVVGTGTLATGEIRGFRTGPNKPIQASTDNLGILRDATYSTASAVNDAGQVAGTSGGSPFVTAPNRVIDPAADAIELRISQTYFGQGVAINNRGHVLGTVNWPYEPAFFYTSRSTTMETGMISAPGQGYGGFNDLDQVAVFAERDLGVWESGKRRVLAQCATYCITHNINNAMQIVGSTPTGSTFLYSGGTVYDLVDLVYRGSSWTLGGSILRINDLGQIAGAGLFNNEKHAFRLDPVVSAAGAIQQALISVQSLTVDRRSRNMQPLILKAALASKLDAALDSWNRGNPAATRGFLNEFENIVRAHTGMVLSMEQANQLIEKAEAAYALT